MATAKRKQQEQIDSESEDSENVLDDFTPTANDCFRSNSFENALGLHT